MNQVEPFPRLATPLSGAELQTVPLSHRYAEKEDIPHVFVMYIEALRELNEPHDEKDALDFLLRAWSTAPCIILENDDNIIGFAALHAYAPLYDKKRVELHEIMFFVDKNHRGLKSWRELSKAVQETADKFNLTFIGSHLIQGEIPHHLRLIRMAGAKPKAIQSIYKGK